MYKLIHGASVEVGQTIAVCDTMEQAQTRMVRYLDERNIESYYMRNWFENDTLVIDYGSWSKFFYVVPVNNKTVSETIKEGSDA